jgi:tetratricopeptide (TPR) repeat protein
MRVIACSILVLIGAKVVMAQTSAYNMAFARYLMARQHDDEAIYVLQKLDTELSGPARHDSVAYLLGNIYYRQQNLALSSRYFDQVSDANPRLKSEAEFFSGFNHAYMRLTADAYSRFLRYLPGDSILQHLRIFELAGLALLQRNLARYDSLDALLQPAQVYLTRQQTANFRQYHGRIREQPRKSPGVAVALSAVLPGAGRFYAGNRGQGIYTFLISAMLGLQTWEAYEKAGLRSFRFIAYSTLFTSLYVGTLWGSAFAVKIKRDQVNETIDNQILFDMHIPLRTFFH